jgi:hypothetical protein
MRKVSERAPLEIVAVSIALTQQNRRRGIAIRNAFDVHGQLESLRFKLVKNKIRHLHGKQNRPHCGFTTPNQKVKPKTRGNFRLERSGKVINGSPKVIEAAVVVNHKPPPMVPDRRYRRPA